MAAVHQEVRSDSEIHDPVMLSHQVAAAEVLSYMEQTVLPLAPSDEQKPTGDPAQPAPAASQVLAHTRFVV